MLNGAATTEDLPSKSKLKKKEVRENEDDFELNEPFTVDQLNVGAPAGRRSPRRMNPKEQFLSDHVEEINHRVQEFVDRSPIRKESSKNSHTEWSALETLKQFEFDQHPAGLWIAKDLGLDLRVFNRKAGN